MSDPPENTEDPGTTRVIPRKASQGSEGERSIGPYRLLQLLGEGGMGEVWLARQERPVRRKVAVKILKSGLDSKRVVARFEAERQALALMDHPAVAKVYDAGTTPEGRPYVVMELVAGLPVAAHCDLHRLSTRDRLELFIRVCEGVQHAHHKAVIHRDLKPSNVLVTLQDGRAAPKIIDFGLAKALAQPLTERTLLTEVGSLVGTPEYMSPEQAQPTAQDIDTRTDVYSLGVILYELLVGALPYDSEALRAAGFAGMILQIATHQPERPSRRLASLMGVESMESARRRRVDVATLERQLAGDLDWITMKALEKDRSRRYGSPAELAADIERHLTAQPVLARPPSAVYRAGKFVRRHTAAVVIAGAALVLLLAFAVGMAFQAQRIAQERDRANREAETSGRALAFLTDLFEVVDPEEAQGDVITAREVLDRGAQRLETELAGEPLVQARLMLAVGKVYRGLGLSEPAAPLLERSFELRRELLGADHPETLEAQRLLGQALLDLGEYDRTELLLEEVLERRRRTLGAADPRALESLADLGVLLYNRGRLGEAEPLLEEALAGRLLALGEEHPDALKSSSSLGAVLWAQGRRSEAEPHLRRAFDGYRRALGDSHPRTLTAMRNVASILHQLGRRQEAEPYFRQTLDGHRRVLGDLHPATLRVLFDMTTLLREEGRLDEAEGLAREALEGSRGALGEEHPTTLAHANNLGVVLFAQGRLAEAEGFFRQAAEGRRRALGEEHRHTLISLSNLGAVLQERGQHEKAGRLFRQALEARLATLGEDHPDTLHSLSQLGVLLSGAGDLAGAEPYLRRVADGRRRVLGERHRRTLGAIRNLGSLLRRQGELEAAESFLVEAHQGFRETLGEAHVETLLAAIDLAALWRDQGRIEDAATLTAQVTAAAREGLPPGHRGLGEALASHGRNLTLLGRHAEAEPALEEAVEILAATDQALAREAAEHLADLHRRWARVR